MVLIITLPGITLSDSCYQPFPPVDTYLLSSPPTAGHGCCTLVSLRPPYAGYTNRARPPHAAALESSTPLRTAMVWPTLPCFVPTFLNRYKRCATGSRSPARVKNSLP